MQEHTTFSQQLTLSYISHKYQNNLEPHSNPNWHWYTILLTLPLYYSLPWCSKSMMNFVVFTITLILPRMGKWSISKVFLVFHLNLICGKLFSFVQLATTLRIFSYCIHWATATAQPKQEQKQSKLKQAHLCLVLFLRLLWAEGPHMMDSYQPLEIKSVSFKEHLYFVNQLNHMNSTSMNRLLFYSN